MFLILIFEFIIVIIARILFILVVHIFWRASLPLWFACLPSTLIRWCRHSCMFLIWGVVFGSARHLKVDLEVVWKRFFFTVFSSCGFAHETFLSCISLCFISIQKFYSILNRVQFSLSGRLSISTAWWVGPHILGVRCGPTAEGYIVSWSFPYSLRAWLVFIGNRLLGFFCLRSKLLLSHNWHRLLTSLVCIMCGQHQGGTWFTVPSFSSKTNLFLTLLQTLRGLLRFLCFS